MRSTNLYRHPDSKEPPVEVFEPLLTGGPFKLERIVSTGQTTPKGTWLDQRQAEWVVLLAGAARLRFADEAADRDVRPGDHLWIAPRRLHRVEWTSTDPPAIWLAVHYEPVE